MLTRRIKILLFSISMSLILILAGIVLSTNKEFASLGNALLIGGIITAFLPYGIYSYFSARKFSKMEEAFPAFLRDLSESVKSGMSLPQAFRDASNRDYGNFNREIEKVANQLSWGVPFPEAMERMIKRTIESKVISRALTILLQSYKAGGDIATTIDVLSSDITEIRTSEEKRKAAIHQHLITIYIIFFLFVIIMISLYKLGIVNLIGSEEENEFLKNVNFCTMKGSSFVCNFCPIFGFGSSSSRLCYYKSLFMFMIIIQGTFNGLIAGQVSEGRAIYGLRHSLIMTVIGFLIYIIAI